MDGFDQGWGLRRSRAVLYAAVALLVASGVTACTHDGPLTQTGPTAGAPTSVGGSPATAAGATAAGATSGPTAALGPDTCGALGSDDLARAGRAMPVTVTTAVLPDNPNSVVCRYYYQGISLWSTEVAIEVQPSVQAAVSRFAQQRADLAAMPRRTPSALRSGVLPGASDSYLDASPLDQNEVDLRARRGGMLISLVLYDAQPEPPGARREVQVSPRDAAVTLGRLALDRLPGLGEVGVPASGGAHTLVLKATGTDQHASVMYSDVTRPGGPLVKLDDVRLPWSLTVQLPTAEFFALSLAVSAGMPPDFSKPMPRVGCSITLDGKVLTAQAPQSMNGSCLSTWSLKPPVTP